MLRSFLSLLLAGCLPLALYLWTYSVAATGSEALFVVTGAPSEPALSSFFIRALAALRFDPLAIAALSAAVFGAATSVVLTATLERMAVRPLLATVLPWFMTLTPVFWREAASGGSLPFATLPVAVTLLLLVIWYNTHRTQALLVGGAFATVSLGASPVALLFAPAYVLLHMVHRPHVARRRYVFTWFVLAVLAVATALLVPRHILTMVPQGLEGGLTVGSWTTALAALGAYAFAATATTGLLLLGAAVYGAVVLWRWERPLAVLLLGIVLLPHLALALLTFGLRLAGDGETVRMAIRALFPSFLALALLAGAGLERLLDQLQFVLRGVLRAPSIAGITLAALLVVLGVPVANATPRLLQSHPSSATLLANELLATVPERTLLFFFPRTTGDQALIAALQYAQRTLHRRPDVRIMLPKPAARRLLFTPSAALRDEAAFVRALLAIGATEQRPVVATRPFFHTGAVHERSTGTFFFLTSPNETPFAAGPGTQDIWLQLPKVAASVADAQLLADVLYARALFFVATGAREQAAHAALQAIQADPMPQSAAFRRFLSSRQYAQTLAPQP